MKKNKFLPIAIILLGLINTGCQNKNTLENNKNITIGTSMKLEKATRDEYNYDTLSSGISELPLVSKNTDGTFSPLLVDYTTSDSKIWTLTLNDNYRWSDGNNVTAEDILFSLEYEWDNNTPLFSNSNEKGEFETYSISEDNKSISLTLEKANIKYLDNLTTFRIRPKHILYRIHSVYSGHHLRRCPQRYRACIPHYDADPGSALCGHHSLFRYQTGSPERCEVFPDPESREFLLDDSRSCHGTDVLLSVHCHGYPHHLRLLYEKRCLH